MGLVLILIMHLGIMLICWCMAFVEFFKLMVKPVTTVKPILISFIVAIILTLSLSLGILALN